MKPASERLTVTVKWSAEDQAWIATDAQYPAIVVHAPTQGEAFNHFDLLIADAVLRGTL